MINSLEHFIHIAICNLKLLESDYFQEKNSVISKKSSENMLSFVPRNIESSSNQIIGYKTIELGGIAKFFGNIERDASQEIVYENTLGMTIHGIDAITKDKHGTYTIYEIKGTTRKLSIIECQKEEDSSYTGKDIHTVDFDLLDILDDYNMSKQEKMLTSLKERKAS